MDTKLSPERRADLVLEQMTLDEKIGLLHGEGMARQKNLPPEDSGGAGSVERWRGDLCWACRGWGFRGSK